MADTSRQEEKRLATITAKQYLAEEDFLELSQLRRTTFLMLHSGCTFPKGSFRHLIDLPHLEALTLEHAKITTTDLAYIGQIRGLRRLTLRYCPVRDSGVKAVASLLDLEWLDLQNTQITDGSLKPISRLSNLRHLWLDGAAITDKGLAYLKPLSCLEHLGLRKTAVTNSGLLQLADLSRLSVDIESVSESSITREGLDTFFQRQQAKLRGPEKELTAHCGLDEAEARDQLRKFLSAMNKWWKICVRVTRQANAMPFGAKGRNQLWKEEEMALDQVFSEYCVTPQKARAEKMAPGMVYYPIDKMTIRSVEKTGDKQLLFNIDKHGDLDSVTRYQFLMRKKKGRWLVDHKKVWRGGWKQEPF